MSRHAYLVLAHDRWDVVEKLLALIDDERNDIFVHVDASVGDFDRAALERCVARATLMFTERVSLTWADYSIVAAELVLLRASTAEPHDFYHLLSGADLPLRPQDDIHDFFDDHLGQEFVQFDRETAVDVPRRMRYYRFLQSILGREPSFVVGKLDYAFLRLQEMLRVDRGRNRPGEVAYGSMWFSITDELARFVLDHASAIRREHRWTECPDEQFLHTLVWNSLFRERLHQDPDDPTGSANVRVIDFSRGNGRGSPYTFRDADFDELMASGLLFARKFDSQVDSAIIGRVSGAVLGGRADRDRDVDRSARP